MKLIYNASNSIEANLILNQLEQSGISGKVEGEYLQGIELIESSGLVRVLVKEADFEKAKKIVEEIEIVKPSTENELVSGWNYNNMKIFLLGGIVGAIIITSIYYLPIAQQKFDRNGDGKVDEKAIYINYQLSKMEFDRNFDGKPDFKYTYNRDGSPSTSESDENFDGIFETKATYRAGNVITSISDTTNDGFADYHVHYKHGVVEKILFKSPQSKKTVKVQYFKNMMLFKSELDTNGDGLFDVTYKYDDLEEIIK